ncbi:hypothetical protein GEMRC1_013534 [Eukaryota sp. GEM-RC1]
MKPNISCFICTSTGFHDISICRNHFVCSPECLELWKSQNCSCLDCSDLPESITSTPQTTCEELSSLGLSLDDASSNSIHLTQTLLVLINAHLLRLLLKTFLELDPDHIYPPVLQELSPFFNQIGHVSQRFLQTVFPAVKLFVESNTFTMLPRDLSQFYVSSSAIGAKRQSVCLFVDDLVQEEIPLKCSHMVASLILKKSGNFLTSSDLFVFPRLQRLTIDSNHLGNSFFTSLMLDSPVEDLRVVYVRDESDISDQALAEVFATNTRLRKVSYSCWVFKDDQLRLFSYAISSNHSIQEVSFIGVPDFWIDNDSNVILPLLTKSNLSSLVFPPLRLNNNVFMALMNNFSLKTAIFGRSNFNSNILVTVLNNNRNLKRLELQRCSCDFEPFFKCLETNTSVLELIILCKMKTLNSKEILNLVEMLSKNTTLIHFTVVANHFSNDCIQNILKARDTNSELKYVTLRFCCTKSSLIERLTFALIFPPHLVDVKVGLFQFSLHRPCKLSNEEVSSLISFVRTFSIKYLTLQRCTLSNESINELCDLIKLNASLTSVDFSGCRMTDPNVMKLIDAIELNSSLKSINLSNNWICFKSLLIILELILNGELQVNVDVSPHVVDVKEGIFCYDPGFYLSLSVEQLSSLKNFKKSFTLRNLTLNRCQFSEESIGSLCDLIKCSSSLTSIDFSLCSLSDSYFMKILSSLQHNSYVNGLHLTFGV